MENPPEQNHEAPNSEAPKKESRRSFLHRFIPRGDLKAHKSNSEKETQIRLAGVRRSINGTGGAVNKKITRRDFVKKSGVALAGVAAVTTFPHLAKAEMDGNPFRESINIGEELTMFYDKIKIFDKEHRVRSVFDRSTFVRINPQTLDGIEKGRKQFVEQFSTELKDIFERLDLLGVWKSYVERTNDLSNETNNLLNKLIRKIADYQAHGLLFRFIDEKQWGIKNNLADSEYLNQVKDYSFDFPALSEKGLEEKLATYEKLHIKLKADSSLSYFSVRVKDYLPTGEVCQESDIDPRFIYLQTVQDSVQKERMIKNIEQSPGWTTDERKNQFKDLLDNSIIRDRVLNSDMTLSEVYSIIKAIVKYRETHDEEVSEIIEKIFAINEKFDREVILGQTTDTFINFNYNELESSDQFSGRQVETIAKLAGVKQENIVRIDGADKAEGDVLLDKIRKVILESRGKTTIYFNTHGAKTSLSIDSWDIGINANYDVRHLATDLINKLQNGEVEWLGNLNIILDSCFSYDFAHNLLNQLKRFYKNGTISYEKSGKQLVQTHEQYHGVKWEDLKLPTIITAAQQGSWGFSGFLSMETSILQLAGEIKVNGVTGKVLKRAQADSSISDATNFYGHAGQSLEISQSEIGEQENLSA
jgi:hypothetical protein